MTTWGPYGFYLVIEWFEGSQMVSIVGMCSRFDLRRLFFEIMYLLRCLAIIEMFTKCSVSAFCLWCFTKGWLEKQFL